MWQPFPAWSALPAPAKPLQHGAARFFPLAGNPATLLHVGSLERDPGILGATSGKQTSGNVRSDGGADALLVRELGDISVKVTKQDGDGPEPSGGDARARMSR